MVSTRALRLLITWAISPTVQTAKALVYLWQSVVVVQYAQLNTLTLMQLSLVAVITRTLHII